MNAVAMRLPAGLRGALREIRDFLRALPYAGSGRRCAVCEKPSRRFRDFGTPRRTGAMCPRCGALERHRFVWSYFARCTDLFDGTPKRVLHLAPERCFEPRLRKRLGDGYVTADLRPGVAMMRMDVTAMPCASESFDVVYCSHVLQFVPDDRRAMQELRRVLKRDGWAIFLVPTFPGRTLEFPPELDPAEKLARFGATGEVRLYGDDVADRLRESGFSVTVRRVADLFRDEERTTLGLTAASGPIYHCRR